MEWRPTRQQILWTVAIVFALLSIGVLFWWLWGVLAGYIQPKTPTDKKDLVNVFVVIGAGVVGTLTAIAAVGNLIVSRRNLQNAQANLQQQRDLLQQQRDLDERRAQDDALHAYYEQIGDLLTEHKLMDTTDADDPVRLLARAQTMTMLERLGSESARAKRNKGESINFLYGADLISRDSPIVELAGANLGRADFRGANLSSANLRGADLSRADLSDADLNGSNLRGAYLRGATLTLALISRASLRGANLRGAKVSRADLSRAILSSADLRGANLSGADLGRADLSDANLSGAILSGAYLRGTILNGAILSGAILNGATVTEEQLLTCRNLEGATMPNGMVYKDRLKDKERRVRGANSTDSS
jgi:uncharacterized protein YjbI with pentapeptide repeats